VRATGDHAYVAMGVGGLRILSVANPAAPVVAGSYVPAEDNYFNDVKLLEVAGRRYAVLAGSPSEVIDVTAPASASVVATIPAPAHTLFIEGTMAYFVDGTSPKLTLYDLADPRAPVYRSELVVPNLSIAGFHDLHVAGGIAYLSAFLYGLVVVDCRTPTAPVELGRTTREPTRYWHSP